MEVNKTVIVTGGNSGLGLECAKVLGRTGGWHVVIASRNLARVSDAVAQLKQETGWQSFSGMALDLASFASVRAFVESFGATDLPPLHGIICNAGVTLMKNRKTEDGVDFTFGVNHLGHYLMVQLLTPLLQEPGRVIFVSSGTHVPEHRLARNMGVPAPRYTGAINLAYPDKAPADKVIQAPPQRYSTSKLCNVLCAYEMARQFEKQGKEISVFAIDPGLMPGTGLAREAPSFLQVLFAFLVGIAARFFHGIRFPAQSGADLARLLTDDALSGRSSLYFDGHREIRSSSDSYDLEKARDLWNTSSQIVGLVSEETLLPVKV